MCLEEIQKLVKNSPVFLLCCSLTTLMRAFNLDYSRVAPWEKIPQMVGLQILKFGQILRISTFKKPDVVPLFCSSVFIDPLINKMHTLAGLVINLVILGNLRKSQSSLTHYHLTC